MTGSILDLSLKANFETAQQALINNPAITVPTISYSDLDIPEGSLLRSSSEVSYGCSHIKRILEAVLYNDVDTHEYKRQRIQSAYYALSCASGFWRNRRLKLQLARNAYSLWNDWNSEVRKYYTTGLVASQKSNFLSVPYEGNNINNHIYLAGMCSKISSDPLFGSDDNSAATTFEVAQSLISGAVNRASSDIEKVASSCKDNCDQAEITIQAIDSFIADHELAIGSLTSTLQYLQTMLWIVANTPDGPLQQPGTNEDVPGGAGS